MDWFYRKLDQLYYKEIQTPEGKTILVRATSAFSDEEIIEYVNSAELELQEERRRSERAREILKRALVILSQYQKPDSSFSDILKQLTNVLPSPKIMPRKYSGRTRYG